MKKQPDMDDRQVYEALSKQYLKDLKSGKVLQPQATLGEGEVLCVQCDGRGSIRKDINLIFTTYTRFMQCSKCRGTGKIKA